MIVLPAWCSRSMISKRRSVSRAVSEVVGSSKMRMRASTESALATSTSCRSPGDRRSTRHVGRDVQVHHGQELLGAPRGSRRGSAAAPCPWCGKSLMKKFSAMVRLVKRFSSWWMKAMPARSASRGSRGACSLAVQQHLPRVERHDAAQDVHERGLAGPVLADQSDDAAALDVEGDALQDGHAEEGLVDVLEAQDGVCHVRPPHALCSRMRRRATSMRAANRMTEPFTMAT